LTNIGVSRNLVQHLLSTQRKQLRKVTETMTRKKRKGVSPTLKLSIGEDQRQRAVASNSGACLIADSIKAQYPHLSNVEVDMATIRATDKEAGERYTYLTPPDAQHVLLAFDQGWPNPTQELTIRAAVHIRPIFGSPKRAEDRAERLSKIQEKVDRGEDLTSHEKTTFTKATSKPAPRPSTAGSPELVEVPGQRAVVVGGSSPMMGAPHPNLLRGRNRIFGAKLADPGKAFNEAVEAALKQRELDV
jgi:hypothetical protein